MHVYLAADLISKSLPADEEEDIQWYWFTESEIEEMIRQEQIIHVHVLAAWALYKLKSNYRTKLSTGLIR